MELFDDLFSFGAERFKMRIKINERVMPRSI